MKLRLKNLSATVVLCLLLSGCGDSATPSTSLGSRPSDTGAASKILLINSQTVDTIVSFSATATGVATPTSIISAPSATTRFQGVATDGDGNIYATAQTGTPSAGTVNIYAPAATGIATPTRTFTPSSSGVINYPTAVAVDKNGNIYVDSEALIAVFAAGTSTGTVTSSFALNGGTSQLYFPSSTRFDANNNFYVGQTNGATPGQQNVLVFNSGVSATSAPARSIVGASTNLGAITGVAGDKNGNVYVAGANGTSTGNQIAIFGPTATGNVAPLRTIAGSATLLNDPREIAVDAAGNLYVLTQARTNPTVLVFDSVAVAAGGNVAPTRSFTSSSLTQSFRMAIY